jgi:hypothetical protein
MTLNEVSVDKIPVDMMSFGERFVDEIKRCQLFNYV